MAEPAWNCLVCSKSALLHQNDGELSRGRVPWPALEGGNVRIYCGYGSKHDFGAGPTRHELLGCICDECLDTCWTRLHRVVVVKRTEWIPVGDQ